MKNKPIKKTLALLLSVLMIISSLVFVVPVMGINYADVSDDNVSQVTGYVNIDPVIYTHGTHSTDEYSYMMNGDTVADGSYAGEFHTNVSVSGKELSSITCVDTGASLSVSSLSVWSSETNSFSTESVLTGALGGGYGSNTMDTKDSTATLKFTFTDGTYELRTLYVKTNPVAQHGIAYTLGWNTFGSDIRVAQIEVAAIGSYGQPSSDGWYSTSGAEKHGTMNWAKIYSPHSTTYSCQNDGKINGANTGFDKMAGNYVTVNKKDASPFAKLYTNTANYYLDISSNSNSGITKNSDGTYSFKMLYGNLYNSKSTSASPIQRHGNWGVPGLYTNSDYTKDTAAVSSYNGMTVTNSVDMSQSGAFDVANPVVGYSTITFSATSAGTISCAYQANCQHVADRSAAARVVIPFNITVVDKSALRNVFDNYMSKKLEAKHYTKASWTAYSHALSEADYYLNNFEVSTENEATLKTNLETAYNNLVPRTYDFNYENLFSFSEWAKTDCRNGNDKGTVVVDEKAGTITLDGSGDFYTLYGGSSSYYQVPVTAGEEYTLSYDVTSTDGKQVYIFFYDDDGNGVTGAIRNGSAVSDPHMGDYNGNNITFTVPSGCTKLGVRFGITGTAKATFSNIALYTTARAKEVGLDNWTNRQYRKVFNYGDSMTTDYTPNRPGYTFNGWEVALSGYEMDLSEFSNTKATASYTLYSTWTINQYTVKFVDKDGKTVSETKYNYGTKASEITVPSNSEMTKDADNHYTYSWSEIKDLGADDVTYNEITTATSHNWNSGVVNPDSTCTSTGTKTYTCSVCGQTKTETVALKNHGLKKTEAKAATCTAAGNKEYYTCSVCGKIFADANGTTETTLKNMTIAALGHDFSGAAKMDSDGKDGTHSFKCVNSGCSEYGNATKHTWNDGVVNPSATCTAKGIKTYTCTEDGCGATYTEEVPANGHTKTKTKAKDATCTEDGNIEYWYCSVCEKYFSDEACTTEIQQKDTVIAKHHTLDKEFTIDKKATCLEKGSKSIHCSKCDYKEQETEIPALGHKFGAVTEKQDANCTQPGHEAYKQCETCKLYFAKDEETNSTNGKADTNSFVIAAKGHTFDQKSAEDKYLASEKNCTAKAKYYVSCSSCGASSKGTDKEATFETGEALGHDFSVEVEGTRIPATCKEPGSVTMQCSRCDATDKKTLAIDPNNHVSTVHHEKVPATCIKEGTIEYWSCSDCDKNFSDKDCKNEVTNLEIAIDENNHTNKEEKAQQDATCTEIGYTAGTYCNDCKKWISGHEEIPALKHDYDFENGVLTRPTQKADGTWEDGYYTYTCKNDSSHKEKETALRADYLAYDKAIDDLKDLLDKDLTDEAKEEIKDLLENQIAQDLINSEQDKVDEATKEIEEAVKEYSSSLKSYEVTFVVNGKTVKREEVVSGSNATAPSVIDYVDETNHYTFSKWDKSFTNVTCNLTVTAVFTSEAHSFTTHEKKDETYHTDKCSCGYTVDVEHSYSETSHKDATCTEQGSTTYTCSLCGQTKTEYTTALGHEMTKTDAKKPTCTEAGNNEYYTCSTCKKVFKDKDGKAETTVEAETIAALGHKMTKTDAKKPTCTEAGNNEYYTCSTCKKVFKDKDGKAETTVEAETIAALGHEMTKTDAKEATCTEAGNNEYYTCSTCEKVFKDKDGKAETTVEKETIAALGHEFNKEVATAEYLKTAGTCSSKAEYYKSCSVCGESSKGTIYEETFLGDFDKDNHVGETEVRDAKTANCHEQGYTGDTYCLGCNTKIEDGQSTAIDKNNHDGETEVRDVVTATCCKEGYTGDTYCLGCEGKIATGTSTGKDSSNHETDETYVKDAKEPTCSSEGYTGDTYHKCCDALISKGETIGTTDHNYSVGDDYRTILEPTCYSTGSKGHYCKTCGAFDTSSYVEIAKTKHTYTSVVTKKATCTTDGEMTYTCTADGCTDKAEGHSYTETITAKGHSATGDWIIEKDATCTAEGLKYKKCANCKEHAVEEKIAIKDHSYSAWKIEKEATCSTEGLKTRKCACGKTETEVIPATNVHVTEIIPGYAATCSKTGLTDGYKCSQCGKTLVEQEIIPIDVTNHPDHDGDNCCDECGTTINTHGSDGCICHKNNIFSKIIRYICTLLTKICRKRIACCNDMEYYGFDIGSIT